MYYRSDSPSPPSDPFKTMGTKEQPQVRIYQKLAISLVFFVAAGLCVESSFFCTEVGEHDKNSVSINSSIRPFCAASKYIMQPYFEHHHSLDDSDFQEFILHKLPSGSHEKPADNMNLVTTASIRERELIGEGSHRHLSTTVRFQIQQEALSLIHSRFCKLIIVESLPSGVFADPFELQHLQQRGVFLDAAVFGDMNLELPSFLSNRSAVEIHLEVSSATLSTHQNEMEINVKLPLHARYQPLDDTGHSRVVFAEPSSYLCCRRDVEPPNHACLPLSISETKSQTGPVFWNIPAGIRAHAEVVSVVTFVTAILSAFSIVVSSICSSYVRPGNRLKQS